jgi:hypothetical protein
MTLDQQLSDLALEALEGSDFPVKAAGPGALDDVAFFITRIRQDHPSGLPDSLVKVANDKRELVVPLGQLEAWMSSATRPSVNMSLRRPESAEGGAAPELHFHKITAGARIDIIDDG